MIFNRIKYLIPVLLLVLLFGSVKIAAADDSVSALYVPIIGLTVVPDPMSLPRGAADVTYNYAVKNFIRDYPLTNIKITDDTCSNIKFLNGDDNADSKLDYSETWRYACTVKISRTTDSTATVTGEAGTVTATHKAYFTVLVGTNTPPPLVSIINVTKIPSPFPKTDSQITFTYKVNNPGAVALSNVTVTDDKCPEMSGELGDTNNDNLLDTDEVWTYTCTATVTETMTSTARVTASAHGLIATSDATLTIPVDPAQNLLDVEISSGANTAPDDRLIVWSVSAGILAVLIVFFFWRRRKSATLVSGPKKR